MNNIKSLVAGSVAITASLLTVILNANNSQAAIIVNVTEVGNDLLWSYEGDFDLTGLSVSSGGSFGTPNGFLNPTFGSGGAFAVGTGSGTRLVYSPGSNPSPGNFGTAPPTLADSSTGTRFGIFFSNSQIAFTTDYSGEFISGTSTYLNQTFATLGLTEGTYVYTYPNDTVTLNIIASEPESVPEPSTLLSLLAVGSLGALVRKGKKS
ncbi:MAG: PEP-CTERM sorting domain-containing protein [Crocosphaera sp.]